MTTALNIENPQFQFGRPSAIYPAGHNNNIFWLPSGVAANQLGERISRVNFKMCFCSIFDDCWLSVDKQAPQEVKTCDPAPTVRYGGLLEPTAPWQ